MAASAIQPDTKAADAGQIESQSINHGMQRYLTLTKGKEVATLFDPMSFLDEMQELASSELVKKRQILLELASEHIDEDDAPEIVLNKCKLEAQSKCQYVLTLQTETKLDTDIVGDDVSLKVFRLDEKTKSETQLIEICPPPLFSNDADAPDSGHVIFHHPTKGKVRFEMSECRSITWVDQHLQKAKKKSDKSKPKPCQLLSVIVFDYMSFETILGSQSNCRQ